MRRSVSAELTSHHLHKPRLSSVGPVVDLVTGDSSTSQPVLRALQGIGYEVKWIRLGPGTVESMRKSNGLQRARAELVILDASQAPQPALSYLEALRGVDGALPVIVIASADPATRGEALRLGAEAVLDAPVDVSLLRSAAESLTPLFRGVDVVVEPYRPAFH